MRLPFVSAGSSHDVSNEPQTAGGSIRAWCAGVRFLGLRHTEEWRGPGASTYARRYLLAAADEAYLEPQQTALDHPAQG